MKIGYFVIIMTLQTIDIDSMVPVDCMLRTSLIINFFHQLYMVVAIWLYNHDRVKLKFY